MTIPSFDRFIEPLLRLLAQHPEGIPASDAQHTLAEQLGVTVDERRELLPSGTYPVYKSRIGWAHDRLKREALSTSVRRGFWKLTDAGVRYAKEHPALPPEELHRLAYPGRESRAGLGVNGDA
jgi:restriction system protein